MASQHSTTNFFIRSIRIARDVSGPACALYTGRYIRYMTHTLHAGSYGSKCRVIMARFQANSKHSGKFKGLFTPLLTSVRIYNCIFHFEAPSALSGVELHHIDVEADVCSKTKVFEQADTKYLIYIVALC